MRLEEQVKVINKQINFLNKYKPNLTKGDKTKEKDFDYAIECLEDSSKLLSNFTELRDNLIECLESIDKVTKTLEKLTTNLIT